MTEVSSIGSIANSSWMRSKTCSERSLTDDLPITKTWLKNWEKERKTCIIMSYITESTPCGVNQKSISNLHLQCMFLWFGQSSLTAFWQDRMLAYSDSVRKNGKNQLIVSSISEPNSNLQQNTKNILKSGNIACARGSFFNFKYDLLRHETLDVTIPTVILAAQWDSFKNVVKTLRESDQG